jgi:hypothetical protein
MSVRPILRQTDADSGVESYFFPARTFAHRAFCARLILLRADADILRGPEILRPVAGETGFIAARLKVGPERTPRRT